MKKSLFVFGASALVAGHAAAATPADVPSSAISGTPVFTGSYVATKDFCKIGGKIGATSFTAAQAKGEMPRFCRPEVTLYITGATAQAKYVTDDGFVKTFFKNNEYFTIRLGNGTTNAEGTKNSNIDSSALGWFGVGADTMPDGTASPAKDKRLYVAYNPKGSIEGVLQIASTTTSENEADMFYPGDDGKCVAVTPLSTATYFCGSVKKIESALALSDVKPEEGDIAWIKSSTGGKVAAGINPATLITTPVGLQAFGVVANNRLYKQLQKRDNKRGLIADSCLAEGSTDGSTYATSLVTPACRPSLSRLEYASLIATNGAKNLGFLGTEFFTQSDGVTVHRRYGGSGTQASSNIFFLNNPCGGRSTNTSGNAAEGLGLNIDKTDKAIANTYGGGLAPRTGVLVSTTPTSAPTPTLYDKVGVIEWVSSTNLKTEFGVGNNSSPTGYHIGVLNVGADDALFKYVKLDGFDPLLKIDSTTQTRTLDVTPFTSSMRDGRYPFAITFNTVQAKTAPKSVDPAASALAGSVTKMLAKGLKELPGVAALPESTTTVATMISKVGRAGNNNCAPLKLYVGS